RHVSAPVAPAVKTDQCAAAGGGETPLVEKGGGTRWRELSRSSRLQVAAVDGRHRAPRGLADIAMLWLPAELGDADFKASLTMSLKWAHRSTAADEVIKHNQNRLESTAVSSHTTSKIFVIGGTGAQGMPIIRALVADKKYSVRFLTRDPAS